MLNGFKLDADQLENITGGTGIPDKFCSYDKEEAANAGHDLLSKFHADYAAEQKRKEGLDITAYLNRQNS